MKVGTRVKSVVDECKGTVIIHGGCPTVQMDDGRKLRGDFRTWVVISETVDIPNSLPDINEQP